MRHFTNLFRIMLAASMLLVTIPGAAVAGPLCIVARQRNDYATEYRLLRPLAEEGNAAAQYGLGIMYENGHGVEQDHAEAVKWFPRAADQGYAVSCTKMGGACSRMRWRRRSGFVPPLNRASLPRKSGPHVPKRSRNAAGLCLRTHVVQLSCRAAFSTSRNKQRFHSRTHDPGTDRGGAEAGA